MEKIKDQNEEINWGNKMKVAGEFKFESIEVSKTEGDEFGIYFCGEGQKRLAFPFSSAEEAIFSAKRLSKRLEVQYNISTEVEMAAMYEKKQETIISSIKVEVGGKKMAKAGNVRKVCQEQLQAGMSQQDALKGLIQTYKDLGKDEKYAEERARVVLVSVLKKMNLTVEDGIKKVTKKATKKKIIKAEKEEQIEATTEVEEPETEVEEPEKETEGEVEEPEAEVEEPEAEVEEPEIEEPEEAL